MRLLHIKINKYLIRKAIKSNKVNGTIRCFMNIVEKKLMTEKDERRMT